MIQRTAVRLPLPDQAVLSWVLQKDSTARQPGLQALQVFLPTVRTCISRDVRTVEAFQVSTRQAVLWEAFIGEMSSTVSTVARYRFLRMQQAV